MAQSRWDGARPKPNDPKQVIAQQDAILRDSLEWFGILKAVLCTPNGKRFLARLEKDHVKSALPASAGHGELAADNGKRAFILQLLADVSKVEAGLEGQIADRLRELQAQQASLDSQPTE